MAIHAIWAQDLNGSFGLRGGMPWPRIPADMQHFKAVTGTSTLIMGRLTWESLGGKPLPGRPHIVVSSQPLALPEGVHLAASPDNAVALSLDLTPDAFVIGGAGLIRHCVTLGWVDFLHITLVLGFYPHDVRAPHLHGDWKEIATGLVQGGCIFTTLEKQRVEGA